MKRQQEAGGFVDDMAGLNRGMSLSRSTGHLVKGSTRPLMQVGRSQAKIATMLQQLDENNREIEMQRMEIRRLREQVHMLMSQLGPDFVTAQAIANAHHQ